MQEGRGKVGELVIEGRRDEERKSGMREGGGGVPLHSVQKTKHHRTRANRVSSAAVSAEFGKESVSLALEMRIEKRLLFCVCRQTGAVPVLCVLVDQAAGKIFSQTLYRIRTSFSRTNCRFF